MGHKFQPPLFLSLPFAFSNKRHDSLTQRKLYRYTYIWETKEKCLIMISKAKETKNTLINNSPTFRCRVLGRKAISGRLFLAFLVKSGCPRGRLGSRNESYPGTAYQDDLTFIMTYYACLYVAEYPQCSVQSEKAGIACSQKCEWRMTKQIEELSFYPPTSFVLGGLRT